MARRKNYDNFDNETDRINGAISYDPVSGKFTWKISAGRKPAGADAGVIDKDGYLRIGIKNKLYRAHKLAWFMVYGNWPERTIDHINCIRDDNRIANLRLANASENQWNKSIGKNNSSGMKGVSFCKQTRRWRASIGVGNKRKCLGRYATVEDAALAYQTAAIEIFGEFARVA